MFYSLIIVNISIRQHSSTLIDIANQKHWPSTGDDGQQTINGATADDHIPRRPLEVSMGPKWLDDKLIKENPIKMGYLCFRKPP